MLLLLESLEADSHTALIKPVYFIFFLFLSLSLAPSNVFHSGFDVITQELNSLSHLSFFNFTLRGPFCLINDYVEMTETNHGIIPLYLMMITKSHNK